MKRFAKILAVIAAILAIAFLIFRVPDTDPDEMRAKYGAAPSQMVELPNGMAVHLRDEGPQNGNPGAPAIVLLHGSNADLHTWQPWVEALRGEYRVIRYDQRGHGLTGPAPDGTYTLDRFTADLDAVADAMGLEQFVVAGNSMGGWIAAGYAIKHPDRLAGLVLVDASGAPIERDGPPPLGFRIAQTPVIRDLARHFMTRSIFERSLAQSVSNQAVVTDAEIDRYWELARYPGNPHATMQRFATPRQAFSAEEIGALDVPTLVMWGEEDALIPLAAGRWYAEHLPNNSFISYKGIGHIPQQENAAQSVDDLRLWLEQLTQLTPAG